MRLSKDVAKLKLSDPQKTLVKGYCSELAHLIGERNTVVHGVWATMMWPDKAASKVAGHKVYSEKSRAPGVMSGASPDSPIYARQLPALVKRVDTFCGKTLDMLVALEMLLSDVTKVPLKMSIMVWHGFQLRWKIPKEASKKKKAS